MIRSYCSLLDPQRSNKSPSIRSKVHFLAIWLHAVIIERMRYNPIGWTKTYEFNEADLRCCLDLIDELIDTECNIFILIILSLFISLYFFVYFYVFCIINPFRC